MRVLLDAGYAVRAPHSGTAVYVRELMRALEDSGAAEVHAIANRGRGKPAGGGLGSVRNLLDDVRWTASLPRRARTRRAALIHHPLPALAGRGAIPEVVTVHDLAFERLPEMFDPRFRAYARITHRAAVRRAAAVICVSQTTAEDVSEMWEVPPERIVVAPHGPGQPLARHRQPGQAHHFLYVGDAEPRKDLPTLLRAYGIYRTLTPDPANLILAGSARADGPGIHLALHPDVQGLSRLYGSALALVHPSRYEGFGLTALEAMSLGVPVLAARAPGILETCGTAARYVPAGDAQALAEAMAEVSLDAGLREQMGADGLVRAADFSWQRCAAQHVAAYSLALSR